MDSMLGYVGEPGQREARVSLAAPAPPPPPPLRRSSEIAAEVALQQQLVDAMTDDVLPRAEQSRDALREAFGVVEGKVKTLGARIALAHQDDQERRVRDGEAPQWGVLTPSGTAASLGLSTVDRLLLEMAALQEREWAPANTLWMNQEHHAADLRVRLSVEQQKLAALAGELTQARAAEAVPPADPEAPGGRLYELRQRLSRMGVGPHR